MEIVNLPLYYTITINSLPAIGLLPSFRIYLFSSTPYYPYISCDGVAGIIPFRIGTLGRISTLHCIR